MWSKMLFVEFEIDGEIQSQSITARTPVEARKNDPPHIWTGTSNFNG